MMNPVLRRETKTTLRNWKMFAILTAYVAIISLGAAGYIYGNMFSSYDFSFEPSSMSGMYVVLCAMQMGLMLLSAPAMTAGTISGERERQTLDLLLMTKMSSFSIVLGKLLSSMATLVLIMVATLPVFAIAFYFGGISLFSLFAMMLYIMVTACMACSLSIFFSCIFKKTVVSMVIVYLLIGGVFCSGTLIAALLQQSLYWTMYQDYPSLAFPLTILVSNPGVGFFSLIDNQLGTNIISNIVRAYHNKNVAMNTLLQHYWILNFIFNIVISVIFVCLSAIFINPVKKKK